MPSPAVPQHVTTILPEVGTRTSFTLNVEGPRKVSLVSKQAGIKVEFIVLPGQTFWLTQDRLWEFDVVLDDVDVDAAVGGSAVPDAGAGGN